MMKKFIAVLLTMLMVVGMVGSVSAAVTIRSIVGDGMRVLCDVETDIMVRKAGATNYNKTADVTAVLSSNGNFFDFQAVVDLANVESKFNNVKNLMQTKIENTVALALPEAQEGLRAEYNAAFNALKIEGSFVITVTYDPALIMPAMNHDMLIADPALFDWTVPDDDGNGEITLTVNVKEGVTIGSAIELGLFEDDLIMVCEDIEAEEIGEYTISGAFSGETDIVEGEDDILSDAIYTAVQDSSDADGNLSATVIVRRSTNSSTSKNETVGSSTPAEKESVEISVTGTVATVSDIDESKFAEGATITADLTKTGKKVEETKINAKVIEKAADKKADIEINTFDSNIVIENEALVKLSEDAKATDKAVVAAEAEGDKIDVTFTFANEPVTAGAKVRIAYKLPEGKVANTIEVLDSEGKAVEASYDAEAGLLTFAAGNGEYTVTASEDERVIILTIGKYEALVYGVEKLNDVVPEIKNDRTMLPIRFVAENLGAKVSWDEETRTVTIEDGETTIEITIDSDIALIDGEEYKLDSPAYIKNDRTYLPVRFVAEGLKARVFWNEKTQEVTISR